MPVLEQGDYKKQTIINGSMLWHLWEGAIFLKEYQFLTVVYEVLPPRTSDGTILCGGLFNGTKINTLSWYTKWESEIEHWTQRSVSLTLIDVPKETDIRRRKRSTETILPTEGVMLHTSYNFIENTLRKNS